MLQKMRECPGAGAASAVWLRSVNVDGAET